jgi:hypothetical protein
MTFVDELQTVVGYDAQIRYGSLGLEITLSTLEPATLKTIKEMATKRNRTVKVTRINGKVVVEIKY